MHKPVRFFSSFSLGDAPHCSFRITRTHNENCWRSGPHSEWHQAVALNNNVVVLAVADLIRNRPYQRFAVWYRWRIIVLYDPRASIRTRDHGGESDWYCWSREQLECEKAIKQELAKRYHRLTRRSSRAKCNRSTLRPYRTVSIQRVWRMGSKSQRQDWNSENI